MLLADDAVAVGLHMAPLCLNALALRRGVGLVIHRQAIGCPAAVQHGARVAHVGRVQSLQAPGRISGCPNRARSVLHHQQEGPT